MADDPINPEACKSYGALTEGVHVAGYTLERAMAQLEWLLEEDRWLQLGTPFVDINDFLKRIKLGEKEHLRIAAEHRVRLARRIKELQPEASQRAIARTLGVSNHTISRDIGPTVAGPHGPPNGSEAAETVEKGPATGPHGPLSGSEAARAVENAENKEARAEAKKERRSQLEIDLAQRTVNLSQRLREKRYGVIYADPPWRFEPYSRETGMDRAPENHYATTSLEQIFEIEPPAANDCILFLWATIPMLPQALDLMRDWGFTYKSQFVWAKDKIGPGYWIREQHELLLIGTKGDVPAPAPGNQYASLQTASRGDHSEKPFIFHEIIEDMFPTVPRVEMFARGGTLAGWDRWGAEVDDAA